MYDSEGVQMISTDEVRGLSIQQGVPLPYIEKDYVMGWLLWGIYAHPSLAQNLVLKGGNCLRKISLLTDLIQNRYFDNI